MLRFFRTLRRSALTLTLASMALAGCQSEDLRKAQMADSPEAYEAFLEQYPDAVQAPILRSRIEELRWMKAKDAETAAAMREYLQTHPEGNFVKKARKMEDQLAFSEAVADGSSAALQNYLDTHSDGKFVQKARYEFEESEYRSRVAIGEIEIKEVNLARDPKGAMNGWGIYADITNNGPRTIIEIEVLVEYLDGAGKVLDERSWWAVAPQLVGMPTPPWIKPPLPPGESRTFEWTSGDFPKDWAHKAHLRITNLRFAR